MLLRYKQRKEWKLTTFSESTSRKLSDFEYKVISFGCGPWRWYRGVGENTYEQGESRRGEER
jgi:hypothetical protein